MSSSTATTTSRSQSDLTSGLRHRSKGPCDSVSTTSLVRSKAMSSSTLADDQDAFERDLLQIWIACRTEENTISEDEVRYPPWVDRRLTWANTKAILRLTRSPKFITPIYHRLTSGLKLRLLALLCSRMALQFLPLLQTYLSSLLLDGVQRSFTAETCDVAQILGIAALDIISRSLETVIRRAHRKNIGIIAVKVDYHFRRDLVASSTSLSLRARASLSVEALQQGADKGDYFSSLDCALFRIPSGLAAFLVQLYVLLRYTRDGSTSIFSLNWLYGTVSVFAPLILRSAIQTIQGAATRAERGHSYSHAGLAELLRADPKELLVFGCRPSIMNKLEEAMEEKLRTLSKGEGRAAGLHLLEKLISRATDKLFEVLLAAKILTFHPSMGSITLCQDTIKDVMWGAQSLKESFQEAYSGVFTLVAYLLAIQLGDSPAWISTLLEEKDKKQSREATLAAFRSTTSSASISPGRDSAAVAEERIDFNSVRSAGMSIEMKDLSFCYPNRSLPTLKNVNLRIEAGETVAIVGLNGSGKTTLLQVLLGLWGKPDGGELLINDIPVQNFDPSTLYRRISCLFQDYCKYRLSLRDNLVPFPKDGRPRDDTELEKAVREGGADDILDKVGLGGQLHPGFLGTCGSDEATSPDKSDSGSGTKRSSTSSSSIPESSTENDKEDPSLNIDLDSSDEDAPASSIVQWGKRMLQRGKWMLVQVGVAAALCDDPAYEEEPDKEKPKIYGLSGGQWQRVALSRAFYYSQDSDLVAFDEPSSALDPEAEKALLQRVHALSTAGGRKRTTIFISHRFSTVRKADKIAFVEDGTVIEFGSHADLMKLEGRYHELLSIQKNEWAD